MSDVPNEKPCTCGRSPTGKCVGLHNMSNESYQKAVEARQKAINEQAKPQLLKEG